MADTTYRISGLYVTPNWNGNSDRVAMSCGIGATIKVLRKVSIAGNEVAIAADPAATMARSWNMTARNTILRTTSKVYLYARVERNGANGMYIWSPNIYNIDGTIPASETSESGVTAAVNHDNYYYISVGSLGADRTTLSIDEGSYGVSDDSGTSTGLSYTWSDLIAWDKDNDFLVFLKTIGTIAIRYIILAGHELNRVLTSEDSEEESSDNAVVTAGFLQRWVSKIQGMFLRKDDDDETTHKLTIGEAVSNDFHSKDFAEGGFDGKGVGMWQVMEDGDPVGYIESDYMTLRRAAYFRSITIAEVNHIGGEVILSQAACQIAYVFPYGGTSNKPKPIDYGATPSFYRCFFEKKAGGREVYNQWRKGDQARCQRWDASANSIEGSFYWRVVVATSNDEGAEQLDDYHWIDLSNQSGQFATGSCAPSANDNIVLLGYRGGDAHDRTCAQVYSTIGSNAPSRRYYEGITSFSLPAPIERMEFERDPNDERNSHAHWRIGDDTHYMDYSKDGLDIRTSSMTIVTDSKDVDVSDALSDNFQFVQTDMEAPKVGGKVATWISADDITPSDDWTEEERKDYLGFYLLTADGFSYEFKYDTSIGYGWDISSDIHLIHAQETADAAVKNLDDMASDNVITRQEKVSLKQEYDKLTTECNSLISEASSVKLDITYFRMWYEAFVSHMLSYILLNMSTDTYLFNENTGLYLVVNLANAQKVFEGTPDNQPYTPNGKNVSYADCRRAFTYYYALLRSDITRQLNRNINSIVASGSDINKEIGKDIQAIKDELYGKEGNNGLMGTVTHLGDEYAIINNRVTYILNDGSDGEKSWIADKGIVTKSNYAAVFAQATDANGTKLSEAIISTSVQFDPQTHKITSNVSLSADKIDFASGSVSVFANDFVIHSDGFTLDKDGNATFSGELRAATGTFSGELKSATGTFSGELNAATGTFSGKLSSKQGLTGFVIDPKLQSITMSVALAYTESGTEVPDLQQRYFDIFEVGTMNGTGSGIDGNFTYQRVAYVTCRSYNSLGQLYHVASIDGISGFRSCFYDVNLRVTSEVDVSAEGIFLHGYAILVAENIATIAKDDAEHRKYLLPGQVYRVEGERTLKINV